MVLILLSFAFFFLIQKITYVPMWILIHMAMKGKCCMWILCGRVFKEEALDK